MTHPSLQSSASGPLAISRPILNAILLHLLERYKRFCPQQSSRKSLVARRAGLLEGLLLSHQERLITDLVFEKSTMSI
ncbi:hypothetical protein D3C86_1163050 [compost metagenome]